MTSRLESSKLVSPPGSSPIGQGRLLSGLAASGALRWAAADLTLPLEEARRRFDLSPIAAVALGRALAAAVLMQRISLKESSRLTLEVLAEGPLGKVVAEASSEGGVRGLVDNAQCPTPEDGRLRIAPLVGEGRLRVTREWRRERYSSQVSLVSGELGDDVAHYLEQSEQIRSAVLLGVLPRSIGISAAGGLIVEALPGTEDRVIQTLEEKLRSLEGVSSRLLQGGLEGLIESVVGDLEVKILQEQELEYRCPCSRQSLLLQLQSLARDDRESLFGDGDECEAVCAFCGARHVFTVDDLSGEGRPRLEGE